MKHWRIGTRVTLGFTAVLLLTMALGAFACTRMLLMEQSAQDIGKNNLPSVIALDRVQAGVYRVAQLLLNDALRGDPRALDSLATQMDQVRRTNTKSIDAFESLPSTAEELTLYASVKEDRAAFWSALEDMRKTSRAGMAPNAQNGGAAELVTARLQKYIADLQRLVELHDRDTQAQLSIISRSATAANLGILLVVVLCIAIAIFINVLLVNSIAAPLALTVAALDQVATGDLTAVVRVQTTDELGRMAQALNAALAMLRSTLQEVAESATTSNTASQQLAASAEEIAGGAQQQAASLEETSASLEQITAAVKVTADNARQASQLAAGCRESAEKGQEVVAKAIGAMAEINSASAKIADIISTINEIAFQTNLLAVNAAVEAARAGEEGRGFAVVAAEVRSLAQRSADAAKEIRLLIEDTLEKVEKGCELVNHSGATLEGIVGSVKRVTEIVGQIAAASSEQSTGVAQVNSAVTQMDQITQSNSAQTDELASAAHSFAQQAARLTQLVHRFKLNNGSDADLPDRPPANGTLPSVAHEELRRQAARSSARLAAGQLPRQGAHAARRAVLQGAPAGLPVRAEEGSFEQF